MLFLLSDLDPVFDKDGHVQESLTEQLGKTCQTINDFGASSDNVCNLSIDRPLQAVSASMSSRLYLY